MRHRHALWEKRPRAFDDLYGKALDHAVFRNRTVDGEARAAARQGLEAAAAARQKAHAAEAPEGPPISLRAACLTEADLKTLQEVFLGGDFRGNGLEQLRDEAFQAPPVPTTFLETLDVLGVSAEDASLDNPDWAADVAQHRGFFSDSVLRSAGNEGPIFFRFLFTLQSGVMLVFAEASAVEAFIPVSLLCMAVPDAAALETRFQVRFEEGSFCASDALIKYTLLMLM